MRYVWDLEASTSRPGASRGRVVVRAPHLRAAAAMDAATSGRPTAMIANSAHVKLRIAAHYARTATVVHPPVEVARFSAAALRSGTRRGDYYLLAGALAPYKRGDLAIEACRRLGRKLLVVGAGQEAGRLRRTPERTLSSAAGRARTTWRGLFAGARALLYPGEEDFGIIRSKRWRAAARWWRSASVAPSRRSRTRAPAEANHRAVGRTAHPRESRAVKSVLLPRKPVLPRAWPGRFERFEGRDSSIPLLPAPPRRSLSLPSASIASFRAVVRP
jgi:hypothetical protein